MNDDDVAIASYDWLRSVFTGWRPTVRYAGFAILWWWPM